MMSEAQARYEARLPWNVRLALALYDQGKTLPEHLLMCVQMVRNGEGCAACAHNQGRLPR
jgi:hypothetical protein